MTIKRMDNVGIVAEDLDAMVEFFQLLGLELEGKGMVEGEWAGRVTGLGDQQVEIAMMRTPDGHSRLELSRFIRPDVIAEIQQSGFQLVEQPKVPGLSENYLLQFRKR